MSWSTLAQEKTNRCKICGNRLTEPSASVILVQMPLQTGEDAKEQCRWDGYEEEWIGEDPVILGYDYQEQYIVHDHCIRELLEDAAAEIKLGVR